jgi:hypothetical protein
VLDFDRMGDIRRVLHVDANDALIFASAALAQPMGLEQERSRGTGLRAPIGDLGEPPYFLQQLHQVDSGGHALILGNLTAIHVPRRLS